MNFESFQRRPKLIEDQKGRTGGVGSIAGPELGEIIKLYSGNLRYRADIRLISGQTIYKIRLPGPWIGKLGFLGGDKIPFREGLAVMVSYLNNRKDSPIVNQVFAFSLSKKTKTNLEKNILYDPKENSRGHESGHRTVWDENKLLHKDKTDSTRFEIDLSFSPTINSLEKAVQGETLKTNLEELIDAINALTVPTALGPSGTAINSAAFSAIKAQLTKILSEVVKHF